MGSFLLFLFIIFLVIPLLNAVFTIYAARRKMRDAVRQMQDAARRSGRGTQERKGGWSHAGKRRKKIGADVGEYVKFEELPDGGTADRGKAAWSDIRPEPQVSDADWEEI